MRSWGGIDGHDRGNDRGLDFASKGAMIALDHGHDRVAIESWPPSDEDQVGRSISDRTIKLPSFIRPMRIYAPETSPRRLLGAFGLIEAQCINRDDQIAKNQTIPMPPRVAR